MTKDVLNLILSIVFIIVAVLAFNHFFKLPGEVDREFLQEQDKLLQEQRLNNGK